MSCYVAGVGDNLILSLIQQMSHFLRRHSVQLKRCFASIFEVFVSFPQGDALQLRPICAHFNRNKVSKPIFGVIEDSAVSGKYLSHFDSQD